LTIPIEELIQEGSIGLCKALIAYDAGRGVRFKTYAQHRIVGSILDFISKSIRQHRQRIYAESVYCSVARASYRMRDEFSGRQIVERLIAKEDARMGMILRLYFLDDLTLLEVGKRVGLGEVRIHQLLHAWREGAKERYLALMRDGKSVTNAESE
jgi:RNA polymerase sigma factor (sigma-70 family)